MNIRRYIAPCLLILALGGAVALAQTANRGIQVSQDPTGQITYDNVQGGIYLPGHLLSTTRLVPPPALTACITGGTPLITGTDFAGVITAGSTASTSCVVTFGTPFQTAPNCAVTWQTGPLAAMSWTTSTTALTITQTSTGSVKISYICTSVG
jgi:hypothetical protein